MKQIAWGEKDIVYSVAPPSRVEHNIMTLVGQKKLLKALGKADLAKRWDEYDESCTQFCLCDGEIHTATAGKQTMPYVNFRRIGDDDEVYPVLLSNLSREGSRSTYIFLESVSFLTVDEAKDMLIYPKGKKDKVNVHIVADPDDLPLDILLTKPQINKYLNKAKLRILTCNDVSETGSQLYIMTEAEGTGLPVTYAFPAYEDKVKARVSKDMWKIEKRTDLQTSFAFPEPQYRDFSIYGKRHGLWSKARASMYVCKKNLFKNGRLVAAAEFHYIIASTTNNGDTGPYILVNAFRSQNARKGQIVRWPLTEKEVCNHFIRIADAVADYSPLLNVTRNKVPDPLKNIAAARFTFEYDSHENEIGFLFGRPGNPGWLTVRAVLAEYVFVTLRSAHTDIIDAFYCPKGSEEEEWTGLTVNSDNDVFAEYRDPNNKWNRGIHLDGEETVDSNNKYFTKDGKLTEEGHIFWDEFFEEEDELIHEVKEKEIQKPKEPEVEKKVKVPDGIDDPRRKNRRMKYEERLREQEALESGDLWNIE